MMNKLQKQYLVEPVVPEQHKTNPVILRVILSKTETRIDFGYAAFELYHYGGWIRIAPDTFIQVQGHTKRYPLRQALNIPMAPGQLDFESQKDWRVFSLIFEPIPIRDCTIDIIEVENPSPNDFNYYGVQLHNVLKQELLPEE
jgi:hypothetical protein